MKTIICNECGKEVDSSEVDIFNTCTDCFGNYEK